MKDNHTIVKGNLFNLVQSGIIDLRAIVLKEICKIQIVPKFSLKVL